MFSRTDWRVGARARAALPVAMIQTAIVLNSASGRAQAPAPRAPTANDSVPAPAPSTAPPRETLPATQSAEAELAAAEAAVESDKLEVVRVTVDRREKRIQDYAGSASVYTPHDMERTGVHSMRNMSDVSPYVHIGVQEGHTEVYIRGVGNDNNTELGDPAAAMHVDGIYIPRPRGVGAMYFDLERVEVGRGPQGTLRGRNATAGSINMVTAKPKLKEWGGQTTLQFGNYSQRLAQGMLNIPLGDKLALRFAAFSEVHEPFYKNAGPIQTLKAAEAADTLAYRVGLKWQPIERLTVQLGHDYMQEKGTGYGGTNFFPALNAGLMPNAIGDPRKVIYRGGQAFENSWHAGVHGDIVFDAGPVLFQYLGSYRSLVYKQRTPSATGIWYPGMATPGEAELDNWSHSLFDTRSQSTVQELRAYAPDSARFRWTLGGFAFYETQQAFFAQVNDRSNGYAGQEFTMPDVKGTSFAGYADGTFDITKSFRATAGVRYTTETKTRRGIGNQYRFNTTEPWRFGTEGMRYAGLDRTDYLNTGSPLSVFRAGVAQFGARDTLPGAMANADNTSTLVLQNGERSDQFIDWRAGLEYNVSPDNLLYATASTGHHSGGFNDTLVHQDTGKPLTTSYRPETIHAFEIGSKNEFFDHKARLNVSLFDYEYQDMQFQTVIALGRAPADGSTPPSAAVRNNAAQSRIMGAEVGGKFQLPFGLVLSADALILDSKFIGDGKVQDGRANFTASEAQMVSLNGKWLPKSSLLTVNYSLSQNFNTPFGHFDWVLSAQTRSKYYLTVFNGEGTDMNGNRNPGLQDGVDGYTRVDLGIGHTRPDGKMRLDGFVNNLTDVWYTTSIVNVQNLNLRFSNPPRQFGVRFTVYL